MGEGCYFLKTLYKLNIYTMKNPQIGSRALLLSAAFQNNIDVIYAMMSNVNASGKIVELDGLQADSQIADVIADCVLVLQANNNANAGVFSTATGKYTVSVSAYTSNSATVLVEVASLDFSYFIDDGAVNWAVISSDDAAFSAAMLNLTVNLTQFKEACGAFATTY
jgi:hypothetical protein